jgi:chromosome condensin MukBEF MukE localization factor
VGSWRSFYQTGTFLFAIDKANERKFNCTLRPYAPSWLSDDHIMLTKMIQFLFSLPEDTGRAGLLQEQQIYLEIQI